jgi:hypothetical protein
MNDNQNDNHIDKGAISPENLAAESVQAAPGSLERARKADASNRGLRTLGQAVLAAVLTFLGALGADMAVPGFELDYQTTAFGLAFVALTPVLAYLQRRAGK